jgi:hypothetical protein
MNMFPPILAKLHQLEFDYDGGAGIDFEPYPAFLPANEVQDWFKAWTGNTEADGGKFLVFGQDGTGGFAAIWLAHNDGSILDQPIVFLGSEGETGVIAKDFDDYLWLLASGHGPYEALEYPDDEKPANSGFTAFAKEHSKSTQRPPSVILVEAASVYPGFASWIEEQCR